MLAKHLLLLDSLDGTNAQSIIQNLDFKPTSDKCALENFSEKQKKHIDTKLDKWLRFFGYSGCQPGFKKSNQIQTRPSSSWMTINDRDSCFPMLNSDSLPKV